VNSVLSFISRYAHGIAFALFVLALYMVVAPPAGTPTETDALQASADIDNARAAEFAALKP
jgi:F0F1-type ATP synthase membrane subunit b/b'